MVDVARLGVTIVGTGDVAGTRPLSQCSHEVPAAVVEDPGHVRIGDSRTTEERGLQHVRPLVVGADQDVDAAREDEWRALRRWYAPGQEAERHQHRPPEKLAGVQKEEQGRVRPVPGLEGTPTQIDGAPHQGNQRDGPDDQFVADQVRRPLPKSVASCHQTRDRQMSPEVEHNARSAIGPRGARTRETALEVDDLLGPLGDLVEVVGPGARGQVLPATVRRDHHNGGGLTLRQRQCALHGAGQGRPRRDPGEDPHFGQAPRPLDRLPRPDDGLAVQEFGTAEILEDGRDVPVVEVAQPVDHLPSRRLHGPDLYGLPQLLAQEAPDAEQRPRRAEPGHEVRDARAVTQDLGSGALVVRFGIGRVGVLVEEDPLGVLLGQAAGHADGAVGPLGPRRLNDLRTPQLEELAALHRHVGRHDHLERVALDLADHGEPDAGVARRRLHQDLVRLAGHQHSRPLGVLDERERHPVLDRPAGILPLELHEDARRRVGAERADVDHRGVADEVEDRGVQRHGGSALGEPQPPATAGRMDTSAPSGTGVSRPCRYRTSSSLT